MFRNCSSLENLKERYLAECQAHPEPEKRSIIDAELRLAWKDLHTHHETAKGEHYEKDTGETADEFIARIAAVERLNGVSLRCNGSWLWADGDTRPHKDALKKLGFRFAPKRSAWYFRPAPAAT